jgi:hypothetical protein
MSKFPHGRALLLDGEATSWNKQRTQLPDHGAPGDEHLTGEEKNEYQLIRRAFKPRQG